MPFRRKRLLPAALALLSVPACFGQSWPQPPCSGDASPAYPAPGAAPVVKVWNTSGDASSWRPPACTEWGPAQDSTIIITVARFRFAAGAEALRRRMGAISQTGGMLYWSVTQKKWQELILEAHALEGAGSDQSRPDFAPAEVAQGRTLYFEQEDNVFHRVTYRMQVRKATASALEVAVENVSPMRYLLFPAFEPGQAQSIYYFERETSGVWRYYAIARTAGKAGMLIPGRDASLTNRAVALYRWLAGIPGDLEPPAAR